MKAITSWDELEGKMIVGVSVCNRSNHVALSFDDGTYASVNLYPAEGEASLGRNFTLEEELDLKEYERLKAKFEK